MQGETGSMWGGRMRLIDADAIKIPKVEPDLYEDCSRCKMYSECDFYDFLDQAPTVDQWHYPSKGEYPTEGEELLCRIKNKSFILKYVSDEFGRTVFQETKHSFYETVNCWQYIEPPKEEA